MGAHKRKKFKNNNADVGVWKAATLILAIALIIVSYAGFFYTPAIAGDDNQTATQDVAEATKNSEKENQLQTVKTKLPIELYVMSQCPYGLQAENTLFEAVQNIGEGNFDLQVEFISTDLGDGKFKSLHGEPETKGNIAQLCTEKHNPEQFLNLILCMNKDSKGIPDNWESCSNKLSLNTEAIKTCYEGEEGIELLQESAAKAVARQASGSPTIYVNDEKYSGGRTTADFERSFCNSFEEQPAYCSDMPEPVKVDVTVLTDKTCTSCSTEQLVQATKGLFPGAEFTTVDVTDEKGKALIEEHDVEVIPIYIFSENVAETESWKQPNFEQNFAKLEDGSYKLKDSVTGAEYYISEEKRQERQEAMGITTGDNKPQIDFFVMSYCPYGNTADEIMGELYSLLGDTVEIKPHYIYYENYQGGGETYCLDEGNLYCSMHGVVEANQNVREQCVMEAHGLQAWFDFTKAMNADCNSKNADDCYVAVAEKLGYNATDIASCEKEKAITFATEDAKLMKLFGATGSPAIYIEGAKYPGARSTAALQAAICNSFDEQPEACDNIVVKTEVAAAPAGACG